MGYPEKRLKRIPFMCNRRRWSRWATRNKIIMRQTRIQHILFVMPYHCMKYVKIRLFTDHKVTIKNANFFVSIVSCLRTHQRKKFYIEQPTVKYSTQWYHMTLIWRHLVLAVITAWHVFVSVPAFAYYRIFCLACYRLCVEQCPAFHWAIEDIV